MRRSAALILTAAAATMLTVTGCSSDSTTTSTPANSTVESSSAVQGPSAPVAATTIIDVRTPEEFAAGHLEGAVNINLQGPDFNDQIMALDKNGTYEVYCRSGNRSAQAVSMMQNAGFTNVTDRGSAEAASQALGIPVIAP